MSTFVLVHGAWGGSFGWRTVRGLLQQAGHTVFTPSLTGLGERAHLTSPDVNLSTHTQDVVNAIWYEDLSDIVLVGHSYGGMVVTGVADRMHERIQHLAYLDAFVPADGQSLFAITGLQPVASDGWQVPPRARTEGANLPDAEWNTARRTAQSRATFDEAVRLSAPLESRAFSLTYILGTERQDPGEFFDRTAERLRGNPRWTVHELPGGHNLQRTNPHGVFQRFVEVAQGVPAASR